MASEVSYYISYSNSNPSLLHHFLAYAGLRLSSKLQFSFPLEQEVVMHLLTYSLINKVGLNAG
jgi:hypothetical protein